MEQWNPYKEQKEIHELTLKYKYERNQKLYSFFNDNIFYLLITLVLSLIIIFIFIGWYIDRTNNAIKNTIILDKLNSFTVPKYFELKSINPKLLNKE